MTAQPARQTEWSPTAPATVSPRIVCSGTTHVGRVRTVNEDAYLIAPPVFVVADGMGGYERGDVAAAILVEEFDTLAGRATVTAEDIAACVERARTRIRTLVEAGVAPGSTLVAAAYSEQAGRGYWIVAHEGDSRAYVWRGGVLTRVTTDHSVVQEMVDAGRLSDQEARVHPERNVITRALGGFSDSRPDFSLVPVEDGARLLLCSDGLTDELTDPTIARVLADEPSPAAAVDLLVRRAVEAGGRDNVTAVLVDVTSRAGEAVVEDTLGSATELVEDTLPGTRRMV